MREVSRPEKATNVFNFGLTDERLSGGWGMARLVVVSNGEEAIRYLKGEDTYADRSRFPFPNLVLLDLDMPKLTGFEVLSWLRRWPAAKHLPVVILAVYRAFFGGPT